MLGIWVLLMVAGAGVLGGFVNALLTDNGFLTPRTEQGTNGKIIRPGFLGNIIIGALSATISFALYGANANSTVTAHMTAPTLAALAGAMLVGASGARALSAEVDKRLLRAAAAQSATTNTDVDTGNRIANASPAGALAIANQQSK